MEEGVSDIGKHCASILSLNKANDTAAWNQTNSAGWFNRKVFHCIQKEWQQGKTLEWQLSLNVVFNYVHFKNYSNTVTFDAMGTDHTSAQQRHMGQRNLKHSS